MNVSQIFQFEILEGQNYYNTQSKVACDSIEWVRNI